MLEQIQEQMGRMETEIEEVKGKNAGLEAMLESGSAASTIGEEKKGLREKKSFEPKFRTARMRKYPIAGDVTNMGFVVGWTSRGAYQEVDRTGVNPQVVDFIEVIYLGHERGEDGKLKAEKIRLLDFLNKGEQIVCKIINVERKEVKQPTGEEINVTVFDPQHGLVSTGDVVDGFVTFSETKYTLQVPGIDKTVEVDGTYVNS